jgi:hypothetical protein
VTSTSKSVKVCIKTLFRHSLMCFSLLWVGMTTLTLGMADGEL